MFIGRWGIFWKDLQFSTIHMVAIIHACCRLHNFCVDIQAPIVENGNRPCGLAATLDRQGTLIDAEWRSVPPTMQLFTRTVNVLRDILVGKIKRLNLIHGRSLLASCA
jgi:hypothetical protein